MPHFSRSWVQHLLVTFDATVCSREYSVHPTFVTFLLSPHFTIHPHTLFPDGGIAKIFDCTSNYDKHFSSDDDGGTSLLIIFSSPEWIVKWSYTTIAYNPR